MFVISDLVSYTADNGAAIDYLKLPGINPRDPQTGIPIGAAAEIHITPAGLSNGDEVYAFFDRLRDSSQVTFDGENYPTVYEPYMGRYKCLIKLTYTGGDLVFRPNLTTPAVGPASVGSLQIFKVDDTLEFSDEVVAVYPLNFNTSPRAATERKEDDSSVGRVLGDEPRLTVNLNLTIEGDYADDTDVNSDFQKLLSHISPQKNFIFQARQAWQTWIIGVSESRVILHSYDEYNRQTIRGLALEVS